MSGSGNISGLRDYEADQDHKLSKWLEEGGI